MQIEKPELVWSDRCARVGLYGLRTSERHGRWTWQVDDSEEYEILAGGSAPDEASAQRAAVDALAAHLEEMMATIRAWRREEV